MLARVCVCVLHDTYTRGRKLAKWCVYSRELWLRVCLSESEFFLEQHMRNAPGSVSQDLFNREC